MSLLSLSIFVAITVNVIAALPCQVWHVYQDVVFGMTSHTLRDANHLIRYMVFMCSKQLDDFR